MGDLEDRLLLQFFRGKAGDAFRRRADIALPAVRLGNDHNIIRMLNQEAKAFFAVVERLFGLLALADVARDAKNPKTRARVIVHH